MRAIRYIPVVGITLALLVGTAGGVMAQTQTAFVGSLACDGPPISRPQMSPDETGQQMRGLVLPVSLEASDARISGTGTRSINAAIQGEPRAADSVSTEVHTLRIENEMGAWQGTSVVFFEGAEMAEGFSATDVAELTGEGDYAGLVALVQLLQEAGPGCGDVRGVIIEGEPPPAPEPPAPAAAE